MLFNLHYKVVAHILLIRYLKLDLIVGELHPAELSQPPQMRINLPRHDLLGEERWPISQRRRALSLSLNGLFLSSACLGMHIIERRYGLQIIFLGSWGPFESGSGRQGDANWP